MARQVIFKDFKNKKMCAGIMQDNGDIICGCCGGLFEAKEKGETWELVKKYRLWIDIEEAICGDDDDLLVIKQGDL